MYRYVPRTCVAAIVAHVAKLGLLFLYATVFGGGVTFVGQRWNAYTTAEMTIYALIGGVPAAIAIGLIVAWGVGKIETSAGRTLAAYARTAIGVACGVTVAGLLSSMTIPTVAQAVPRGLDAILGSILLGATFPDFGVIVGAAAGLACVARRADGARVAHA